jgi:fibronectin type 3 domain-containing protein
VKYEGKKAILSWLPNPESDVVSYRIYEKTFLGNQKIGSVNTPEAHISGIQKGKKRGYAVTAVDADGLESNLSEKITVLIK